MRSTALACLACLMATTAASASSSTWYRVEGGAVRLVTAGVPDGDGVLRGALEIVLKHGWKTYWRDPGDAGVPPSIDISPSTNVASAVFDYPAPHRFDDGYAVWAGYKEPVALPVTFTAAAAADTMLIEADIFLGICETICIPVQTRLSLDPADGAADDRDTALVEAAFAALPEPARADFGVSAVGGTQGEMLVQAAIPGDVDGSELFVAASEGYIFGVPELKLEGERTLFSVPILDRPAERPAAGALDYTLVTSVGAVSGTLRFP
ncbi:MAG: hypothetical protein KF723_02205 [Rhizobiaceae bacterium]|nr:hypothetical protein [Rhizobiaceae bacterium]